TAAAGELGDQPAGGERAAEGHQRTFPDQRGGAVTQFPALVHDVVVLFARHAAQLAGGRAARPCAAGQVAADLLGAAAQVVAGGAGSLPECIAAIARGLLQVVAGFGQVFLQLLTARRSRRAPGGAGGGRVAAGGGRIGCAHLGTAPVHVENRGQDRAIASA